MFEQPGWGGGKWEAMYAHEVHTTSFSLCLFEFSACERCMLLEQDGFFYCPPLCARASSSQSSIYQVSLRLICKENCVCLAVHT